MPIFVYVCPDCRNRWERTRQGEPQPVDRCTRCAAYGTLQDESEENEKTDPEPGKRSRL